MKNDSAGPVMIHCKVGTLLLRPGMGWVLRINGGVDVKNYGFCALCKKDVRGDDRMFYCKKNDLMFCQSCDQGGAFFSHPKCYIDKGRTHEHFNIITVLVEEQEE